MTYEEMLQQGYNPEFVESLGQHGETLEERQRRAMADLEAKTLMSRLGGAYATGMTGAQKALTAGPFMGADPVALYGQGTTALSKLTGAAAAPTPGTAGDVPAAPNATVTTEESDFRIDPSAVAADPVASQAADWEQWDQQTAARQWDRDDARTIAELREAAGLEVHDDDPANRYTPPPDPDAGITHDAFKGKHYRNGRQITPQRGRGVGDAAARNAGKGGSFTAGRMAPPTTASWDYVQQNESPAIQRIWKENKLTEMGFNHRQAQIDMERARADLINAEVETANLPPEERMKRKMAALTAMHEQITEQLLPSVTKQLEERQALFATDPAWLAIANDPVKKAAQIERWRKEIEGSSFNNLMMILMQLGVIGEGGAGIGGLLQEQVRQAPFMGAAPAPPQ